MCSSNFHEAREIYNEKNIFAEFVAVRQGVWNGGRPPPLPYQSLHRLFWGHSYFYFGVPFSLETPELSSQEIAILTGNHGFSFAFQVCSHWVKWRKVWAAGICPLEGACLGGRGAGGAPYQLLGDHIIPFMYCTILILILQYFTQRKDYIYLRPPISRNRNPLVRF